MKIKSSGNYNIISKDLNADNKISLKTKNFLITTVSQFF